MPIVSATASCPFCSKWSARHTADTPIEVGLFLQKILDAHVAEAHPTKAGATRGITTDVEVAR